MDMAANNDSQFIKLSIAASRPDILDDPRGATPAARINGNGAVGGIS